jgi:plasmid stabilization system protein ParE
MGKQEKTIRKTYQVRISAHAMQNIDEITGYIAFINHQPANASKVGNAIFEIIEGIGDHPYGFRACEYLPTTHKIYRRAVCYSWQIIYKVLNSEILILGIIHSSKNPSSLKLLRKIK